MKTQIKKQINNAFGKDIYLLGEDKDGTKYWLEYAQWSCGWYWGFGYVETYTNNSKPHLSKDTNSHQHIESSFLGKQDGKYVSNIFDSPLLSKTTFTEDEGWLLSELFRTFYTLQNTAKVLGTGSSHITTNPISKLIMNTEETDRINQIVLPKLFKEIYKILTPKK